MPSRPPETRFYEDQKVRDAWRNLSREYEFFCDVDPDKWPEKKQQFITILEDMLVRLRENPPAAAVSID